MYRADTRPSRQRKAHARVCDARLHKESLVVGVFGQTLTLKYDLVYKVGRLDKGKLLVRWGDNHEYAKGYYPSIALIHTGVEGIEGEDKQRYYVVETHQSRSGHATIV